LSQKNNTLTLEIAVFHALLAFGSISKHFHHTKPQS